MADTLARCWHPPLQELGEMKVDPPLEVGGMEIVIGGIAGLRSVGDLVDAELAAVAERKSRKSWLVEEPGGDYDHGNEDESAQGDQLSFSRRPGGHGIGGKVPKGERL